jgi:hypothetical protein
MSGPDLARMGKDSLQAHLVESATQAHIKYRALRQNQLYAFLSDADFVRFPVRLNFNREALAPHQFGQPEPDPGLSSKAYILTLHPRIREEEQMIRQAIAFFVPIMNFGTLVTEDLALLYGATLTGMPVDKFYKALCHIADFIGAVPCFSGETSRIV